jgi:low temperature requirement protein LtrA
VSDEMLGTTAYETASERHAGWLELFYDLLFVVLMAQLAHAVLETPSWSSVTTLVLLFAPAWWIWVGSVLYTNLTGEARAERRLDVLVQMGIVLVIAASVPAAVHGHIALFAGAYAVSRVQVVLFRILSRQPWPSGGASWPVLVSAALWLVSIPVGTPIGYGLWLIAIAVEATPWLARRGSASALQQRVRDGSLDAGHLVERFGLFMIIILGEGIAQIVAATNHASLTAPVLLAALGAFCVIAMLWWLYFDHGSAATRTALGSDRISVFRLVRSVLIAGHFFLAIVLLTLMTAVGHIVTAVAEGEPTTQWARICCLALVAFVLHNSIVATMMLRHQTRHVAAWSIPNLLVLGLIAVFADVLGPHATLLLIAVGLAVEPVIKLARAHHEPAPQH